MRLDDRAADREADAHPAGLGGDEGLEQPVRDLVRDAGAGVRHGDLDHLLRELLRASTVSSRRSLCCMASRALRIRLTMTCWIWTRSASTDFSAWGHPDTGDDALLLGADQCQGARLLDQPADRLSMRRSVSPRVTNSRRRRMIWPARRACSAVLSRTSIVSAMASGSAAPEADGSP